MAYYVGPNKTLKSDVEDRREYVAAAGQTSFACVYTIGYVDVTVNGVLLQSSDYTATTGTTVVLDTPCELGDEVTIRGKISSKPYDFYLKSQVDAKLAPYGIGIGSGDSMSVTFTPAVTGLADGAEFKIRVPSANASATPSVTFAALGISKTLVKFGNQPLQANDLNPGQEITARYNSTTDKLEITSLIKIAGGDVGDVKFVAGTTAPQGWMVANGAAVSRTAYADLFDRLVTDAGFTQQTFTVTVASPAVVTRASHGFLGGERIRLSTTGALPTGLSTTVDYYVLYVSASTFNLSLTFDGTAINTSGTQSGTHSYVRSLYGLGDGSTTFNLPDLRGEFIRGWDNGRGLDAGRNLGAIQRQMFETHVHGPGTGQFMKSGINGGINSAAGTLSTYNGGNTGGPNSGDTGAETRPRNVSLLPCIKF